MKKMMMNSKSWALSLLIGLCFWNVETNGQRLTDRFNYRDTNGNDFGPSDWGRVGCSDVTRCEGWPDDWQLGIEWRLEKNSCRWCPANSNRCGRHHQSPINLERNRAVAGDPQEKECIDLHWMKYEDSSCTWDQLVNRRAFTIERHTLKMTQPLEQIPGGFRLDCPKEGGRRFGRIDFSKGFSDWWFLSHIDFKVPSEHTQEGKRYSGEVQMAHFYSVSGTQAMVNNEMAHVTMFLEAYDDAPPHRTLDRFICQWRREEERVREQCNLPSVGPYPGCFNPTRGHTDPPTPPPSASPSASPSAPTAEPTTPLQVLMDEMESNANGTDDMGETPINATVMGGDNITTSVSGSGRRSLRQRPAKEERKLIMGEENWREPERTDAEWEEWAEAYSAHSKGEATSEQRERLLLQGDELIYHNYQFLIDVKTEYYYRYSGTQTVPPCYGPFTPGTRGFTNHWRVLKDPIRVHPRQIAEMERLLKDRIAPAGSRIKSCQSDTAAKVDNNTGRVSVARPLQKFHEVHFKTFCECQDWISRWPEDREWCAIDRDVKSTFTRIYDHPYNFDTAGEF